MRQSAPAQGLFESSARFHASAGAAAFRPPSSRLTAPARAATINHFLNMKIFYKRNLPSSKDPTMPHIERTPSELPLPFSTAVQAGGFIFLSGQIALTPTGTPALGTIEEQTTNVLERISTTLAELGSSRADVVRVTVWLSDLALFARFNEVYRGYFKAPELPARSTVQARLAFDVDVEIEVTAYRG
jgi:reactive intermediate/imine deaminase